MGQSLDAYQKKLFIKNNDTLPYRILLPENFDKNKTYPLIIFLHGAGERGTDNENQLIHGGNLFLKKAVREEFPAIVVFPQCKKNSYWSNVKVDRSTDHFVFNFFNGGRPTLEMELLKKLIKKTIKDYPIRKEQVYAMGLSMGGMGTFELVSRMPKTFAAAIPICGGANPEIVKKLKHCSWWVFHGAKDNVVAPKYSEAMVNALKAKNIPVKFTLYPDANHNSWDAAFSEPQLLNWLFSNRKNQ